MSARTKARKRALDLLGGRLAQLYGQGESPMTITHLSREMHADRLPIHADQPCHGEKTRDQQQ